MKRINIAAPEFEYDETDPEGFRSGMVRPGPGWGAKQLGTSVYEIPPGQALCPYHYEYAEEEWLLVLIGGPTLRDPDGEAELEPWDMLMFETGPAGAHAIYNRTDEPVRVMMWSTVRQPAITVYPDSDKIAAWTGNRDDDVIVPRSAGVGYFHGEGGADTGATSE
jgi:uncharacterized cupin superfamily protein